MQLKVLTREQEGRLVICTDIDISLRNYLNFETIFEMSMRGLVIVKIHNVLLIYCIASYYRHVYKEAYKFLWFHIRYKIIPKISGSFLCLTRLPRVFHEETITVSTPYSFPTQTCKATILTVF